MHFTQIEPEHKENSKHSVFKQAAIYKNAKDYRHEELCNAMVSKIETFESFGLLSIYLAGEVRNIFFESMCFWIQLSTLLKPN